MQGYRLTDSPDASGAWTFPAVTIGPGQYLIIYLDGKNIAGAGEVGSVLRERRVCWPARAEPVLPHAGELNSRCCNFGHHLRRQLVQP